MTDAVDREVVRKVADTAERTAQVLAGSLRRMRAFGPLDGDRVARFSDDERMVVDAFLKRFENACEMGKPLFRAGLLLVGEPVRKLSLIDVLNTAEKLELLPSASVWQDALETRNKVAHEYSMEPDLAAAALTETVARADGLVQQLDAAVKAVRARLDRHAGARS